MTSAFVISASERLKLRRQRPKAAITISSQQRHTKPTALGNKQVPNVSNVVSPRTCLRRVKQSERRCTRPESSGFLDIETCPWRWGVYPFVARAILARMEYWADKTYIGRQLRLRPMCALRSGVVKAPNVVLTKIVDSGKSSPGQRANTPEPCHLCVVCKWPWNLKEEHTLAAKAERSRSARDSTPA